MDVCTEGSEFNLQAELIRATIHSSDGEEAFEELKRAFDGWGKLDAVLVCESKFRWTCIGGWVGGCADLTSADEVDKGSLFRRGGACGGRWHKDIHELIHPGVELILGDAGGG